MVPRRQDMEREKEEVESRECYFRHIVQETRKVEIWAVL